MAVVQRAGMAVVGAATTMLARRVTRMTLHGEYGEPKLPRVIRRKATFRMMLLLAAAAGVVLALGDLLQEQRKHVVQHASADGSEADALPQQVGFWGGRL